MTRCPFCGNDPFDYVNIGIGIVPVAVTCCTFGILLFERRFPEAFLRDIYDGCDGEMNGCDYGALLADYQAWLKEQEQ